MKLAIIGFGELGKQLLMLSEEIFSITEVIIFDDFAQIQPNIKVFPFDFFLKDDFKEYHFVVGLGYKHLAKRKEIFDTLLEANRKTPSLIHPSSFVSKSAKIHEGVYLYPMCNIDKNVEIQTGSLLNNSVTISHDSTISKACYLSPSVTLSGFVEIGECSFLGTGSIVSNNISIGKEVIIGIGSVITSNIVNNQSVIGNPAKVLKKNIILK